MDSFTAQFELPKFIPKEEIMGKRVFDSEVVYLGIVEDWTYASDGEIKMVVKKREGTEILRALISFSHIDRVGQFILLKKKGDEYKILKQQMKSKEKKKEGKNEEGKNEESTATELTAKELSAREYFNEIEKTR